MRFELLTHMTVSECNKAVRERLQTSRQLEGWTDKDGVFSLAVSSKVARVFSRTTHLQAAMERDKGVTTIKGYVSTGVAPRGRMMIVVVMILAGFLLIASGYGLPGIIAILTGPIFLIPMAGDYTNSETLLREVRRTLRAREGTPPKPVTKNPSPSKPTSSPFSSSRSTTGQARKPPGGTSRTTRR